MKRADSVSDTNDKQWHRNIKKIWITPQLSKKSKASLKTYTQRKLQAHMASLVSPRKRFRNRYWQQIQTKPLELVLWSLPCPCTKTRLRYYKNEMGSLSSVKIESTRNTEPSNRHKYTSWSTKPHPQDFKAALHVCKPSNINHHRNQRKKKNHRIISTDAGKALVRNSSSHYKNAP